MDAGLRSTLNRVLCDGRVYKREIKELATSALDGKGVTENELKDLKQIRAQHGDKMTRGAAKSLDSFIAGANRSWSRTQKVHLPNVDEDRLQDLLNGDPRLASRSSSSSRGGESSGGGARRVSSPAPRSTGRVSGGE